MSRVWFVIAAVGAINLLSALAVAFWAPSFSQQAGPSARPWFNPILTISPGDSRFEQRVRSEVRREMDQLRNFVGPLNDASPNFTAFARNQAGARGSFVPPSGAASGGPGLQRTPTPGATPAVLTPFGLYPAGFRGVGMMFLSLCVLLAAGSLTAYLAPSRLHMVQQALHVSWRNLALLGIVGLLGYGMSLLLMFILVTLVVGIPFAVLLLLVLAVATVFGFIGVSLALGRWLRDRLDLPASSPLIELALGIVLIFPLGLLPFIGWPVVLLVAALGFGAFLVTKGGTGEPWSVVSLQERTNDLFP